jgi:hypothetical protein
VTVNRIFLGFMVLVGIAVGAVLVLAPETRDFHLPPYFWVLIAMAAFELIAFARWRGAPGTVVTMDARLGGFLLAIVLMVAIPMAADAPSRLF